jgi:hypothetical protein
MFGFPSGHGAQINAATERVDPRQQLSPSNVQEFGDVMG